MRYDHLNFYFFQKDVDDLGDRTRERFRLPLIGGVDWRPSTIRRSGNLDSLSIWGALHLIWCPILSTNAVRREPLWQISQLRRSAIIDEQVLYAVRSFGVVVARVKGTVGAC